MIEFVLMGVVGLLCQGVIIGLSLSAMDVSRDLPNHSTGSSTGRGRAKEPLG
jgi:hypothetical protein